MPHFQRVEVYRLSPGVCYLCRSSTVPESGAIDCGMEAYDGRVVICGDCLREASRLVGMEPAVDHAHLEARVIALEEQLAEATAQADSVRADLDGFLSSALDARDRQAKRKAKESQA